MNKLNAIISISSLLVGVFIGTHAQQLDNAIIVNSMENKQYNTSQVQFYDDMIVNANTIKIYNTSELTHDIMQNRNGKIIVEKIIGEVTNSKLDGKILNASSNNENYTNKNDGLYINYERVNGAKVGDKIVTYFIYNPFTNAQDDVLTRLDFIIDCNEI